MSSQNDLDSLRQWASPRQLEYIDTIRRLGKRYVHVGHRHHVEEKEFSGIKIIQHSTLAARDAYAARGGWMSERQMLAITYHADHGEVARSTVTPEMLV